MGAGSAIATVRMTSERVAKMNNNVLIRINPREAEVPTVNIGIEMGALEALLKINERF